MDLISAELTILMPCLNEAETLGGCIKKAQQFLLEHNVNGEVVIADNGSTDGSPAIAGQLGARVVHVERKGYGAALLGGIQAAAGKYVIMADADDSYNFLELMPLLEKLRQGYELVMGNRFKGGILPGAMPPLHQYLGNPVLSGVGRLFFRIPVSDFHCGLRGFNTKAIKNLKLKTSGMEFASEMVIKASIADLSMVEVPIVLHPDGRSRRPHLRSWRDGWRHLRFMLLFSPRWLFLFPGIVLIVLGLFVGAWLMPAPRTIFGATLDIHTLLYCAVAILVGFQSVLFAVFAKVYAINHGLLPEDKRLSYMFRYITLETGLLSGFILLAAGLGGSVFAFVFWQQQDFGPINPSQTFRLVIPAALAVVLGSQMVLSSFFLSVLGLDQPTIYTKN